MSKYILVIVIFFILFGSWRLIVVEWSKHNHTITADSQNFFTQKEALLPKIIKLRKHKPIIDKNLFSWLAYEITATNSWKYYKKTFISDDGRVIDYQRDSVTTSEGQAYAM